MGQCHGTRAKHIWTENFLLIFKELAPTLGKLAEQSGEDYIYTTVKYICNVADYTNVGVLTKIINDEVSSKVGKEAMTTIAEKWLEEGRQEGEMAATQSIAQRLLEQGADIEFVAKVTGYSAQELETLME